jgi:hypothetical protein
VLTVLGIFPLGLLVFWAVRLRFGKRFRGSAGQGLAGPSLNPVPSPNP